MKHLAVTGDGDGDSELVRMLVQGLWNRRRRQGRSGAVTQCHQDGLGDLGYWEITLYLFNKSSTYGNIFVFS
jgi:hypothetical protein